MIKFGFIHMTSYFGRREGLCYSFTGETIKAYLNANFPDTVETTIIHDLESFDPKSFDIYGISSITENFNDAIMIAKRIRASTNAPLILGGVHISVMPQDLHEVFDVGVLGEGELTLAELMAGFLKMGRSFFNDLTSIQGVVWHGQSAPIVNDSRQLLRDLNSLPPLDYENITHFDTPPIILGSRGCPYRCRFCMQAKLWQNRFRVQSIDYIVNQIKNILRWNPDLNVISLSDDNFFHSKPRAREFLTAIRRESFYPKLKFFGQIRSNYIDEEMCRLLKEINVVSISFGFETASDRLLKLLNKKVTLKDHLRTFDLLAKYQIPVTVSSMIGIPTETEAELRATYDVIGEMVKTGRCLDSTMFIFQPYPGTCYWADFVNQNKIVHPFDYRRFKYFSYDDCIDKGIVRNLEEWIQLRNQFDCIYHGDIPKSFFYDLLRELIPHFDEIRENYSRKYTQIAQAKRTLRDKIAKLDNEQQFLIFGTGLLTKAIIRNENFNDNSFIGFIDSDNRKQGEEIVNKRIYSPDDIRRLSPSLIFISATLDTSRSAIHEKIRSTGYSGEVIAL